ncbi:MAG: GldG family protein [Candidatus Binatia bacterium]
MQGSLGAIGLVLLFFAGMAWGLTRDLSSFVIVNGAFGLFALIGYLASGRQTLGAFLGERSTRYGANAIVYSSLFVGIVVMANFLASRYNARFDTTEAKVYSLSDQSAQVVKGLDQELEMIAFIEGGSDPVLEDLFKSYAHESPKLKYQLVDPDRSPDLAERYNITAYNTVRVAYGEQSTLVNKPDEESITNAIIKVTQSKKKTICLVEGHGEPDSDDVESPRGYGALKQSLANENYGFRKILLATEQAPPNEECTLLIIPAPKKPWLDPEVELLKSYLQKGGRAVFLFAPMEGAELRPIVAEYGIEVGENVVVDQVIRLFQAPALGLDPIANTYGTHAITEDFAERTMFPMTRTVEPVEKPRDGLQVTALVKTSRSSWAESDIDGIFQRSEATLDPAADRKGPLSIAAAAQADLKALGSEEGGEARIVVFGSQQLANNKFIETFFNRDLVLNAVGWAAGEEKLISVRARSIRASTVQLQADEVTRIFYLSVLILPELLLLAGIVVWTRRRNA